MPLFMVERSIKDLAPLALAAAHAAMLSRASQLTSSGRRIHLVRSILMPGERRCVSFFECADAETVWRLLEDAGIPHDGAMEVYEPGQLSDWATAAAADAG